MGVEFGGGEEEEEEKGGVCCGGDVCGGAGPDSSGVDGSVLAVTGVGGRSCSRGEGEAGWGGGFWVMGLVEGELVGGDLGEGGEGR